MPDLAFVPTGVLEQVRYKAARAAILGPLVTNYTTKPLPEAFALVRAAWRKRVATLADAGYAALVEPDQGKKIQYMRNCPPSSPSASHAVVRHDRHRP